MAVNGLQYYVGANGAKVPIFQNIQQKAAYFAALPDDRQRADFISQHQDLQQLVQQSMGTPAWNQWINHASTLASGGSNESALANASLGVNPTYSPAYQASQGLITPNSPVNPTGTSLSVGNTGSNPLNAAGNPNANMDDINYQKQLRQTAMDSQIYNPNGANTWGIQNSTAENLRGAFGGGVIAPNRTATPTASSAASSAPINPATGQSYQATSDPFGGALSTPTPFNGSSTPTPPATEMSRTSTPAQTPAPNPAPSYFGGNMTNNNNTSTPTTNTNTIGSGSFGAGGQLQGQNLQTFDWSTYDPSKA